MYLLFILCNVPFQATDYLLQARVGTCPRNNEGDTPLHFAARESAMSTLFLMVLAIPLRDRATKNNQGKTAVRTLPIECSGVMHHLVGRE